MSRLADAADRAISPIRQEFAPEITILPLPTPVVRFRVPFDEFVDHRLEPVRPISSESAFLGFRRCRINSLPDLQEHVARPVSGRRQGQNRVFSQGHTALPAIGGSKQNRPTLRASICDPQSESRQGRIPIFDATAAGGFAFATAKAVSLIEGNP